MDLLDVFQKEEIRPSVKVVYTILLIGKDKNNEARFTDEELSFLTGLPIPVVAYSRKKLQENGLLYIAQDDSVFIYKLIDKKRSAFDMSKNEDSPF